MSRKDKLLVRLQDKPKNFTWDDAVTLMRQCGFTVIKGKGSRRKFVNKEKDLLVIIHEPHPQNTLKAYNVNDLIDCLKNAGEITSE